MEEISKIRNAKGDKLTYEQKAEILCKTIISKLPNGEITEDVLKDWE